MNTTTTAIEPKHLGVDFREKEPLQNRRKYREDRIPGL